MRRLLLVAAWLLFVFLLLQLAGFVFYQFVISRPISGYGYPAGLEIAHPELGYHYQPEFSAHFKGTAYQHILVETNPQGFRDADFAPRPGEGARLAVLGDSVVLGPGVEAEARFTQCLDEPADADAPDWRVLNLGVHAYSFGHYVRLAELGFLGAEPDAVLLGITLNDFAPMDSVGPARRARRHAEGWHKPDWVARIQARLGRTYAARFLDELETRIRYALLSADQREAYHTQWMRTVVEAWQQTENRARFARRLDQFVREVRARDLPLGFVLFPELNGLRDPHAFDAPRQQVRAMLDARGLEYCDPYDLFARQPDLDSLFLVRDSVHYTPAGHQLLCRAIEGCLQTGALSELAAVRAASRSAAAGAEPGTVDDG